MYIPALVAIALLSSGALASPVPTTGDTDNNCPIDRSILKSCSDLTLSDEHNLEANCQDCKGAWQSTSLDLDNVLGNKNGTFFWGDKHFSETAQTVDLDSKTANLSAYLEYMDMSDPDGPQTDYKDANVVLSDRIHNDDGQLRFA
ncbi:hypothetical protein BGZ93_000974 [Podila epicladia]|nr:hypothetical protein BGZ92_002888 [Podila epicladia]KAG0084866.1 hypothetical protein BGZ93_000974 [Podila epicladia]